MTNHKLCMIPGPIEFHEDVLSAMATPATSHVDPTFINMFGECIEMLRKVVLTKDGQPFILSGSGTLGWDSVICNLIEDGEEILQVNTGYFGDHFGHCAETYGYRVTHVKPPKLGDCPSLEKVKAALIAKSTSGKPYKLINITHVDTSTGVLTDVKAVASIVKQVSPQTLISVDGVCSIGAEELRMDEWGIDAIMTASQKALGTPSGLCVMVVSQRGLDAFKNRKTAVKNYFGNWSNWLPIMEAYESRKPKYFATPAVNLIMALHTSLKQITSKSMDERFDKHCQVSNKFKDTLESWGLKLVPASRELASNTISAVYYPEAMAASDLLPKITAKGIIVAGGLHPEIAAKYFRVGHMGISATETERGHMQKVVEALHSSLNEAGFKC